MDVERRLERLEVQNRRLRSGLYGFMLIAVGALCMGASKDQTVDLLQARRIQIIDSSGRPMVILGEQDGQGFAALLDVAGTYKVHMTGSIQGGTITLKNQQGHELVELGYDAGGNGNIQTSTSSGGPLAQLGASEGSGLVATYDNSGREHVKLGTTHGGAGAITTFNSDGVRLISVTATTKGEGLVAAFDSTGQVRSSWP